jgi:hypothetical protein
MRYDRGRQDRLAGGAAMRRVYGVAFLTTALLAHGLPPWAGAASKYKACGLLTAADLKAVLNVSVDKTQERT